MLLKLIQLNPAMHFSNTNDSNVRYSSNEQYANIGCTS